MLVFKYRIHSKTNIEVDHLRTNNKAAIIIIIRGPIREMTHS